MICSPITTCSRSAIHIKRHTGTRLFGVLARGPSSFCYYSLPSGHFKTKYTGLGVSVTDGASSPSGVNFHLLGGGRFPSNLSGRKRNLESVSVKQSLNTGESGEGHLEVSFLSPGGGVRFLVPKQGMVPEIKCKMRNLSWSSRFAYTGLIVSLLVCYSSSQPVYAEAPKDKEGKNNEHNGKRVYTDYSIIGIPGDGRCLFRSVAHGLCLRSGRPPPNENAQRELADELRARVADEFIKRREETEWFVEGDFDSYVAQIRKPHVWGGEPELFMASHVLRTPIAVYMHDEKAGGLICIAEYGQEYGKEDPIHVIYHGYGHYDALLVREVRVPKPKL
ncbi:PREDICTED: OTU domain-containing protein At3g57810 [Tarenaya hassleriana]|uniref:OTU domain-containing protein At3g57810 n=1 Tax=Tarenaya hassleriana TaxID=28532 RepID=UPI00053C7688|nr:PREDICTED: OTU domain-containing protein At3g57810 [Tarenaya hassleriana]XP_010547682.1 PREDICTED: OTU domain-containing protein At3g57810 [Tarenaya hassleriana]